MEPLKEMFNKAFYEKLAQEINKIEKNFKSQGFVKEMMTVLEPLSLNERMRQTTHALHRHLSGTYKKRIELMNKVIPAMPGGYTNLLFPDYVGVYGREDMKLSLEALKYFTQFGSSEFAIREFLKQDFEYTLRVMKQWTKDKNHHVRRLASEGSRPRLPWSFKLDAIIKRPELTQGLFRNNTLKCKCLFFV